MLFASLLIFVMVGQKVLACFFFELAVDCYLHEGYSLFVSCCLLLFEVCFKRSRHICRCCDGMEFHIGGCSLFLIVSLAIFEFCFNVPFVICLELTLVFFDGAAIFHSYILTSLPPVPLLTSTSNSRG